MGACRLGVDIGGTFTDFALLDEESGRISVLKYPSDPDRPAAAVFGGVKALIQKTGIPASALTYFNHGTTLAVNTILQRKGAKAAFFVTRGFRDILNIGRHRLPDIFNFFTELAPPLVPRSRVVEIDERCLADGTIALPAGRSEIRKAVRRLVRDGVEAIAIGFLHSYKNAANEIAARDAILAEAPGMYVCLSSEVWPQMREFERSLVSVMNAYVGRKMGGYFTDLEKGLRRAEVTAPILSTKSNGGLMTAAEAARRPVETLLSGPAAGAVGAAFVARAAGYANVITLDMGGTSTDVSIIDGEPRYSTENTVGDFPVIMPAIDVTSIGAGGGSIAWIDSHNVLKVGPESAGAKPGPVCYGLGGTRPTLTDAYVCLGIIDPDAFAGGSIKIDAGLARKAVGGLAAKIGLSLEETAESILRIATSHVFATLIPLLARKGVDYSDFVLLPFGGAGPTQGFLAAREIGIRRVIVPLHPGVLCATGALVGDVRRDFVRSVHFVFAPANADSVLGEMLLGFDALSADGDAWLDGQKVTYIEKRFLWSVDMRYLGQSFEIAVPLDRERLRADRSRLLLESFYEQYRRIYGYADTQAELEVRELRIAAVGVVPKPKIEEIGNGTRRDRPPTIRECEIFHDGRMRTAKVVDRDALDTDADIAGPAIIQQYDTTTFVPAGYRVGMDRFGNLVGEMTDGGR